MNPEEKVFIAQWIMPSFETDKIKTLPAKRKSNLLISLADSLLIALKGTTITGRDAKR